MKKKLPLAALAVISAAASSACAQVVYEPFNYSTGAVASGAKQNPGQGTTWGIASTTAMVDNTVAAGTLTLAGLPPGSGNNVNWSSTNGIDRLPVGEVYRSGTIYYSALVSV